MKRPRVCPVCGSPAPDGPAERCAECGGPYDLDTRLAAALERLRGYRFAVSAVLAAAMAWWLVVIVGRPTMPRVLVPVAITLVCFAELTYISHVAAPRIRRRYEDELRSARKRMELKAAAEALPEGAPAGAAADDVGSGGDDAQQA